MLFLHTRTQLFLICLFLFVLTGCAGNRTQPSTGQLFDDSTITTKIKTQLLREKSIRSSDISVETFKGVVQLSGFVNDWKQAKRAGVIASRVPGVKRLENNLIVK